MTGTLRIVAVGSLKTPAWRDAYAEYAKRLQRFVRLEAVDVKDMTGKGLHDAGIVQREAEALLAAQGHARLRVALTPDGKSLDSPAFAEWLGRMIEREQSICFFIGGPLGLAPRVVDTCSSRLSLSPMTFPHEMARVVLMEQLYRAFTILTGSPYHK